MSQGRLEVPQVAVVDADQRRPAIDHARQLLGVARKQPLRSETIAIGKWVPAGRELLRASLGAKVALNVEVDPDVWAIRVDPAELELALINVAVNARAAMPNGGTFTVAYSGAWGLSTARSQGDAIAGALHQCQSKATSDNDCGAELVAYKTGWSLAILCGDHRVLVADKDLQAAEAAAYDRVAALARSYPPGLPACNRLLTVDPLGAVTLGEVPSGLLQKSRSFGWDEVF